MAYVPNNLTIFTAAFAGAMAGIAANGRQPTDPLPADYMGDAQVAGAFAKSVDGKWGVNPATVLDQEIIEEASEGVWEGRSSFNTVPFTIPANWDTLAAAIVAMALAGDAYFTSQGIIPPPPPAADTPLARQRWIDGNTSIPAAGQNGAEPSPYDSPARWFNSFGAQPLSLDDAVTINLGVIAPTATDVWSPTPQTWVIPPARSFYLKALFGTGVTNSVQGQFFPGTTTITWHNNAAVPGGNTPPRMIVILESLEVAMAMTITDGGGGAAQTQLTLLGENNVTTTSSGGRYSGTLDVSAAPSFNFLMCKDAFINNLIVTNPGGGPNFALILEDSDWSSTNLHASTINSMYSFVQDAGTLTVVNEGIYSYSTINAVGLTADQFIFIGCTFTRATLITAANGAFFDATTWQNFLWSGGTLGVTTVAIVEGGFLAGQVLGANVNNPAGNAASLSMDGSGASAGFTTGGNYYKVTSLAANTLLTLLDGIAHSAGPGTTCCIERSDSGAFTLTVNDAGAGLIAAIPPNSFAIYRSDGTNWKLLLTGSSQSTITQSVVLQGATPGIGANESVELTIGATPGFRMIDGLAYIVEVECIEQSAADFQSVLQTLTVKQTGGVVTLLAAPAQVIQGTGGAAPWTLTPTAGAGPARLAFTFSTGMGITAAVDVACTIRYTLSPHP